MDEHRIAYRHLAVKGNKVGCFWQSVFRPTVQWPSPCDVQAHCEEMDRSKVALALSLLMDVRNHPVLIHCRSGKHRTGALIGCLRMLQNKSMEQACTEYVKYCQHKQREVDKQFIERFDPRGLAPLAPASDLFPTWLPNYCCTLTSKSSAQCCEDSVADTSSSLDVIRAVPSVVSPRDADRTGDIKHASPELQRDPGSRTGRANASGTRPTILSGDCGKGPFEARIPT
jgi:hypothetical protein